MKRICLKDQEISELNCTDDFNWQECSDTVPKYLENTSCNQYGHNKNTLFTNEADSKEIIEKMKTSETNILQEITSTDEVAPFEAKKKFCEDEEKQSDPNSILQMICTVRHYSWHRRKKVRQKLLPQWNGQSTRLCCCIKRRPGKSPPRSHCVYL